MPIDSARRRSRQDDAAQQSPPVGAYLALALLFMLACANQTRFFVDLAQDLQRQYAFSWFSLGAPWPSVEFVGGSALAAGLRKGDRVLALEGRAPVGTKDLSRLTQQLGVGHSMAVTVRHRGSTAPETIRVPVQATREEVSSMVWLLAGTIWVALPLLCIALGFGVAAIRPRDPVARLLLGVLLGLSQIISSGNVNPAGWEDWIRAPGVAYQSLASRTWPIWMMLFGLYFPFQLPVERRFWWVKWLLIVPLGALAIGSTLVQVLAVESYRAVEGWGAMVSWLNRPGRTASLLPVTIFFGVLFTKAYSPDTAPEARRRLRLLVYGSVVSLTPIFVLLLRSLVHGGEIADGLPLVIALMMMFLFPVTLAYLVVVDRALDVRVVVRQGVQYALARSSVRLAQGACAFLIAMTASSLLENLSVNTPRRISIIAGSVAAAVTMGRLADRLRSWVDRRFFREAYRSEQLLGALLSDVHRVVQSDRLLETVARGISDSLHVNDVGMVMRDGNQFVPAFTLGRPAPALALDDPTVRQLETGREPVRVDGDLDLLLPLLARDHLMGFISLGPKRSEEPYSGSDVKLLQSVAAQAGLALENSQLAEQITAEVARRERLSRELEIAREVQLRLLPQKQPPVPGLDYAGRCRPALEVGGDYYDFLPLPDGQFGVAIGDVSGKGVPAALLMAALQSGLRGQTVDGVADLTRLMSNLNRFLYDSTPRSHFATFFYAVYDPATRKLRYSNAGHNPPILIRAGEVIRLQKCGPGLGLSRSSKYRSEAIALMPEDCLVLFTDGLSEAMNPALEEWGEEGLVAAAEHACGAPAMDAMEQVLAAAKAFAAGAPQHDDMTVVVLRVAGPLVV